MKMDRDTIAIRTTEGQQFLDSRTMKRTLLSAVIVVALVTPGFAEEEVSSPPKENDASVTSCAICYKDQEWQASLFYSFSNHPTNGGFGGGLGLDYFFLRYFGLGVEGNWFPGGEHDAAITQIIGNVFLRYPVALNGGRASIAPYLFAGGGGLWDSHRSAVEGHIGGGLDWRFSEHWGVFADIRYAWTTYQSVDITEFRSGIRFAF
jgi:opacity protein-like surface antigen